MRIRVHRLAACCAMAVAVATAAQAEPSTLVAPNVVPISRDLVTSRQPTAASLAQLSSLGFGGVIYLAPPTVSDAVPDEAGIVQRQGLAYVNIAIKFGKPTDEDFQAFVSALAGMQGRKILVHCQVNMRASSMVFLQRVIIGKESPEAAYQSVAAVWSPDGTWKQLIVSELKSHHVAFEPY